MDKIYHDTLYAYNNLSTKEALEYLGISQSAYYKRLNKMGIERNKSVMKVTNDEVIKAVAESDSIRSAAKKLGILPSSLIKRMNKLNISIEKEKDYRKHKINDNVFSILSPETAYWLGFIAADGSVVDNTLYFMLNKRDEETLQRFLDFCDSNYKINYTKSHYKDNNGIVHYYDAIYVKITSKKIVADLAKYGIVQNKTYANINYLEYIPEKYRLDFIVGILDGDGSVSYNYSITFAINNSTLVDMLLELESLGIDCKVSEKANYSVIYICDKKSYIIFKNIYLTREYSRMERKIKKFLNPK